MSKRILVVDDSSTVRQQVRMTLEGAGYVAVEAVDGMDALERLTADPAIALVVCDINMPRLDGMGLLRQLEADNRMVPMVMLTTEGQPALIREAKALGAKGWIVKPFKPEHLLLAVTKLAA